MLTPVFISCDEGRLYDNDDIIMSEVGGNAHIKAKITGLDTWPEGYTIALAGFEDGNEFALVSKNVKTVVSNGMCDVTLTGIPSEVSTVELCAIDRLRRRVATFVSTRYESKTDTIRLNVTNVNASMSKAIQQEVFNTTCIQCHGGSNYVAGGLNLTEGKSFEDMISIPSVKMAGLNRVQPGKSSSSVLYIILGGSASSDWKYDHSVEVVRQEKLDLIRNWIDGGANTN